MNKKYILKSTGEEVKFGDKIISEEIKKFSFGAITIYSEEYLNANNIEDYIKKGVIKVVEEKEPSINTTFIIKSIARRLQKNTKYVASLLEDLNKICPRAVFDILLQETALYFYNEDPKAFDEATDYYSLRTKDGKVGKVTVISNYIPLFKSAEDAEKARIILKDQLNMMYGKS
jgi:hypothetical protein